MPMAVYTFLEQYDFTGKTIPSVPMRAAVFPMPLWDIQKTEVGTAVMKGLAIQGSSVDGAKTSGFGRADMKRWSGPAL